MVVKWTQVALLIGMATPVFCHADSGTEQYLEVGEGCARAHEPVSCMESYGFDCQLGRLPDKSVEAESLGCNLDLGDGRKHFVQMLYEDGGWNVEVERTYWSRVADERTPAEEDPSRALSSYIFNEMDGYATHSAGTGATDAGLPSRYRTGARRVEGRIAVRAVCGAVFDVGGLDRAVSEKIESDCESALMSTVMALSQVQPESPFRVAGPSKFEWQRQFARLVSGDSAFFVQGHYTFAEKHKPCVWISGCCSENGVLYLGSCRTPSEIELQVIQGCLSRLGSSLAEEFTDCLRAEGMKVGCEDQADGSRICY